MRKVLRRNPTHFFILLIVCLLLLLFFAVAFIGIKDIAGQAVASIILLIPLCFVMPHVISRMVWSLDKVVVDSVGVSIVRFGKERQHIVWDEVKEVGIIRLDAGATLTLDCTNVYLSRNALSDEERVKISIHAEIWYAPLAKRTDIISFSCVHSVNSKTSLNQQLLESIQSPLTHRTDITPLWLSYPCVYTQEEGEAKRMDKKNFRTIIRKLQKHYNLGVYVVLLWLVCSILLASFLPMK